jgi:hypothetical protein
MLQGWGQLQPHVEPGFVMFCFSSWKKTGGDRTALERQPLALGLPSGGADS